MQEDCILYKTHSEEDVKTSFECRYKKLEKTPIFGQTIIKRGLSKSIYSFSDKIIFVEKGIVSINLGTYSEITLQEGFIFFIPNGCNLTIKALVDSEILQMKLLSAFSFCDCYTIQSLTKEKKEGMEYEAIPIECNPSILFYWKTIKRHVKEDLRCPNFSQIKINEFLFLLGHSFSKKELFQFFYLYLSSDMQFSQMVYKLHAEVKNVSELASAMNYSLSGFQKRFKKVFGVPPSTWMTTQKARMLYIDLQKRTPIKIVRERYNFRSLSHLHQFCQRFFGQGPKQIRENPLENIF